MAATIQVVKLALGHGTIHVDGWEQKFAGFLHFIQAMHAGGGLFAHANNVLGHWLPIAGVGFLHVS